MTRRDTRIRFSGPLLAALLAVSAVALVAVAPPAAATVFSNPTAIVTTDPPCGSVGPATVYPSTIQVSGLTGTVADVNVTLHGMNHFSGEFDILLVGPAGGSQNLVLLSDAGTQELSNFTLTLDDQAADFQPSGGNLIATSKPTDYAELSGADPFPPPAPAVANRPGGRAGSPIPGAGTATLASVFNGINPNGTWSLFVVGDACDDPAETITGGWSIDITTAAGATTTTVVTSSQNPSTTGSSVTFTAAVTSGGSPVATGTVTFTEGATTLASNVPLNPFGEAMFSTSSLTEGNHIITATYNGTASFATSSGSVNQRVNNPTTQTGNTFCNTGPITINAAPNPATPYPSNISVTGFTGNLSKVTLTLKNISHPFADDIDVLLVGPGGQNLVVLSDAGSGPTTNVTVTLDDAAAGPAPTLGPLGPPGSSVTYKPTDHEPPSQVDVFPPPAPAPSAATTLATFAGTNPNGTWSLYVMSDGAPETGTIAGGWCLNFTVPVPPTVTTSATATATLGQPISDTATVTGSGPAPTGTVTFMAHGPNDVNCMGAPAFTSAAVPLTGGPPPTATSGSFTPTTAGTYRWRASYSGDANYLPLTTPCNDTNESSVVNQATPTVTTSATATAQLGQPITDTATVTGVGGAAAPTGTVTFRAYGPNDATCSAAPAFTSSPQTLAGGPPPTATSNPFTPVALGTYRWTASYSGDANYAAVTTACNDANETSVVGQGTPTVTTSATATAALGQAISDTATVTGVLGGPAPTGTVTFTAFGPNDATCAGPAAFTSAAVPLAGGPPPIASSGAFTPATAGTYRWTASYSGDANYAAVTTACNDANETSVVSQGTPTVTTQATPTATLGQPISDTATVTGVLGGPAPTGNVTFTLFGPNDATCTGAMVFNSGPQPLSGGPPPTAASGPFTPVTAGDYRWIASYSGDANYAAVATACNDANETSRVGFPGPHMTLTKTASPTFAAAPATITYTFTLTNDGTDTLFHVTTGDSSCTPVALQSGDVNGDQLLNPGERWTFTCSQPINTPGTYTNTAQASGFNTQTGLAVNSNQAQATVTITSGVSGGHMTLTKQANPTSGQAPLAVTYTFTLVNDGSNPLSGVALADSQCAPVRQSGDFNNDGVLGPGEVWTYTCSVTHPTPGTYSNSATATATDTQTGGTVTSNTAMATVNATGPAPPTTTGPHITLTKAASPGSGPAPLSVTYTYTLVNDGTDALFHVGVTDSNCSPVARTSGDVNNDGLLNAGETWTFTCTATLPAGTHTNSATASGTNTQTGLAVSSNTAQATVTVGGGGGGGPGPTPTPGPHVTLSKAANPTTGAAPLAVTYTYTLVNDGTDALFHVSVTDNACSPVTRTGGDVNNDALLNAGETWTFSCSTTLPAGTHTNTATGSGTNTQTGLQVTSNTAQAAVTVT